MRRTLLLADAHRVLTDALAHFLSPAYDIVGHTQNGRKLVELAGQLRPDLIVLEITLPLLNGIEAMRVMQRSGIRSKFVVLTMHADTSLAVDALRAGASAVVLKQSAGKELAAALSRALGDRIYVSPLLPDVVTLLAMAARKPSTSVTSWLTPRKREVLQLVSEGKSIKEIAGLLSISPRTAESYKYEMMRHLGLHSTAELVQYAIRIGVSIVTPFSAAA